MMYPYSYSYGILYYGREIAIFAAILLAVVLSIVLYFTFLNKKNEGKYKGAKGKIYNFLSFNKFYTEDIMKLAKESAALVMNRYQIKNIAAVKIAVVNAMNRK